MIHAAVLFLFAMFPSAFGSGYQARSAEDIFQAVRNAIQAGQFPTDDQLLDLGFRKSPDVGLELNSEGGRLHVLVEGSNRNVFTMTWSPKEPPAAMHESMLAALITKSSRLELIGRERMKIVINEQSGGPIIFREGFIIDLLDGKFRSSIVEAFAR